MPDHGGRGEKELVMSVAEEAVDTVVESAVETGDEAVTGCGTELPVDETQSVQQPVAETLFTDRPVAETLHHETHERGGGTVPVGISHMAHGIFQRCGKLFTSGITTGAFASGRRRLLSGERKGFGGEGYGVACCDACTDGGIGHGTACHLIGEGGSRHIRVQHTGEQRCRSAGSTETE
ncbi:hypothetical protein DVU_3390 [Nitratidesulfovibrio vulgaris str. Hildenborough]|uniref:Uncharacterized protein n=1 Tax=Nitratidesulfovibrio vulgaris (strain ATCC 29579 / DSM 644 / CCUG 34227 / NCIMB 8303 / VKM B-1760 / Hildenborough) TaxID=882 RepID=Q725N4_NITV2|nr:hypothetical protein DVU_3390 [Nitratidesulfovibrio vulgaris str. Hildenborough]